MKVALLWLVNEKGELLIARRASHMDSDAGVWGPSVSGEIEEGELPLKAVIREAEEELGILPNQITPLFLHETTYEHQDGKGREFSIFYAKVNSDILNKLTLEPEEVAEVKWISMDDLQDLANKKSNTLIISSATELWKSIFANLKLIPNQLP